MPKTKISEFSATPGNNTDIDGINIAEGCAPSGINDAIRELMSQLKDFQTGAAGDSFNGPVGSTTPAAGAFTTLTSNGATTLGDAVGDVITINGTVTYANANPTYSAGTANGVGYLNASKQFTTGSALTFDGTNFGLGIATPTVNQGNALHINNATQSTLRLTNSTTGTASNNGVNLALFGNDFYINNQSGSSIFYISGAEGMRLTSTGLGIGTSSPSYKLDIIGSSATDGMRVRGTTANLPTIRLGVTDVANSDWSIQNNSGNLIFTGGSVGGNVGIGTSSPGAKLDVAGDQRLSLSANQTRSLSFYNTTNSVTYGRIQYTDTTGIFDIANQAAYPLTFSTNSTERARIDSSGNLLVGTTSVYSSSKMTVESTANIGIVSKQGTAGGYCFLSYALSNGGIYYHASFEENGTQRGSITSNGTLTTYNTTSDYRLKNVIGNVTSSGARIDALEPVEYEWKSSGERTRGFLAHKFQEVYPQSVTGTKDAVDAEGNPIYQQMQAGTTEVIADLVAELQSLRKRVAQLEGK